MTEAQNKQYEEVREEIADKVYEASWCWSDKLKWEYWKDVPIEGRSYWYLKADQILSLESESSEEVLGRRGNNV